MRRNDKITGNRRWLVLATLALAAWAGPGVAVRAAEPAPAQLPIVAGSGVVLPVFIPASASEPEKAAAAEWIRVLEKMCGAAPVLKEEAPGSAGSALTPGIYLGRTAPGRASLAANPLAGPDDFLLAVDGQAVILAGATPEATYFAVCRFLQKFGGVNWYYPGAEGEIIPARKTWSVPLGWWKEVPAYISREFFGLATEEENQWARHNLLAGHFAFSHNLANVFDPQLFAEHPDFFPWRDGARLRPAGPTDTFWQPDLSSPAVAAYAAGQARKFFANTPSATSFSLGLNDNVAFDEGPATKALTEPRRWFRGRPDYSDLVFTFMNRVADDLGPQPPGKYLGCLAYFWCENTPTFPVRADVLPYLTNDRSFYTDAAWAREDLDLIRRWHAAGPEIMGIYDYYYGRPFAAPRIFTTAMVDSLREDYAAGARAFVAELYPQWEYDAMKAWLAAQLLWNPQADAGALEEQFYRDLYGAAAGEVRQFFEEAEAAWREQPGAPQWLKGYKDPYAATIYSDARVHAMSGALARGLARDLGSSARSRLGRLVAAWADSVQTIAKAKAEASLARNPAATAVQVHAGLSALSVAGWSGAGTGFLLRAAQWAQTHEHAAWLDKTTHARDPFDDSPGMYTGETLFNPFGPNLLQNGDLRGASGEPALPDWTFTWRPAQHFKFTRLEGGGLRLENSDWAVLWQDVPVDAEKVYEASFQWRGRVTFGARVSWAVAYFDADGKQLSAPWQASAAPGNQATWLLDGAASFAPAGTAKMRLLLYARKQPPGDWVEFSAVQVRLVKPTVVLQPPTIVRVPGGGSHPTSFIFKISP